jgi:hypothetical protein
MPRVLFLRGVVYGGRAWATGEITEVPDNEMWILGSRVEVLPDEPTPADLEFVESVEPERATLTTAEAAGVIAKKRGRPRKR